jgi:putative aldouronate transport system permease protein
LKRFQKRGSRALFLLMLPGLAYFLVFHYGALLGNVIAFKDYVPFDGVWGSRWVGLDNFRRMFEDGEFWDAVTASPAAASAASCSRWPTCRTSSRG